MLQKVIDAAEGAEGADGAAKEKTEQEELRQLLPEVTEKVADAKESQRAASLAIRQALVGRCLNVCSALVSCCGLFCVTKWVRG